MKQPLKHDESQLFKDAEILLKKIQEGSAENKARPEKLISLCARLLSLESYPDHLLGHFYIAIAYHRKFDTTAAINHVRAYIASGHKDRRLQAFANLGVGLKSLGNLPGAIATWKKAVEM